MEITTLSETDDKRLRRSDKRSVIRQNECKWWMTLSLIHPTKPHKNYGNSIIIFAGFAVATSALVMQGCALWLIFPDVDY
jgi:hypothetical protein